METPDQQTPNKLTQITSWTPLLWLSLALIAGLLFSSFLPLPVRVWWILAGSLFFILLLLFILAERHLIAVSPLFLFSIALLAVFTFGATRYRSTIPVLDANYIAWYNDREYEVLVTGTLSDPPDKRDTYTNLRLKVTGIDTGDEILPVHGLILARVPIGGDWHYGDVIRLRGHLETPPENEDFSYRDYLAHQGIRAYMLYPSATRLPFIGGNSIMRLVYTFKEAAIEHVYRIFPEPEASLLAGILLGEDNGLPADLRQAYNNTGTAHIIAISGFNITIIAGFFVALFNRLFGRRRGAFAAVMGIAIYTLLVGASPSVVRAALMGGLALLARQLGRRQNGLNSLASVAAGMAFINPHTLWDVSFQLSFAATLGLVLYARPLQDWFTALLASRIPLTTARKISNPINEFMFFTLAAQLTTLPIVAWHFGRISLVALIANPFILPAQPALMVLSGLALLLSFIYLPLGQVFAWIAWPFAAYTNRAVEFFNLIPHGVLSLGDFTFLFVVLFFLILLFLTFAGARLRQSLRPVFAPAAILTTLGISTFIIWSTAYRIPDGSLHLIFLDVGTADAILIETPSGHSILVNGGPSQSKLSGALGPRLSIFDRHLEWLVIASPQEHQVAALPPLLERFPVRNVLWSGNIDASWSAEELDRKLAGLGTPVTLLVPGTSLDLGQGARLEALSVSPRGVILLVEWQGFRALLPVGMNFDSLAELDYGKSIGSVSALLLADSGFAQLNPPEWLAALHPQVVLLSVAAGDPDGLPDQSVLNNLEGFTLLRTDRDGWIEVSTDGTGLWVEVEK